MENQSYYRHADRSGCDEAVFDRFLLVNCTGVCVLSKPFTANRPGRRDYYLMYLFQGSLDILVDGRQTVISPGELVIFHPDTHLHYTLREGTPELIYYWVHFTGSGAEGLLRECGLEREAILGAGCTREVSESFERLFNSFIAHDSLFELDAAAQLIRLLVLIRRQLDGKTGDRRSYEKIRNSLRYIHTHYSSPITVGMLAQLDHLSPSRYSAVFKECTGLSPQAFIVNLRLERAEELMIQTDLSLKQIARMAGYEDQLYFSRLFKEHRGMSPSAYIAKVKGNRRKSADRQIL